MANTEDIVYYLMPDGTKVSNDPRWVAHQAAEAMASVVASTPNTGHAGIPDEEMLAQIGGGLAPGQSGQPGVGPSPSATPEEVARGNITGAVMQNDDRIAADDAGFDSMNPRDTPPAPIDSNEAVATVRKEAAEAQAKAKAAMDALGDDGVGDPSKPYSEWSAKQVKAELFKRQADRAEEDQIPTDGVRTKADVVTLLEADDVNKADS